MSLGNSPYDATFNNYIGLIFYENNGTSLFFFSLFFSFLFPYSFFYKFNMNIILFFFANTNLSTESTHWECKEKKRYRDTHNFTWYLNQLALVYIAVSFFSCLSSHHPSPIVNCYKTIIVLLGDGVGGWWAWECESVRGK